jgi:hypothetical protein
MDKERHDGASTLRRSARRWLIAPLTLLLAATATAIPAVENDIEAKVKAAYLYHLTKFVDWPSLPANEVRICLLGAESVGGMMADLSNRQVRDRPLKIEVETVTDPAQCQVLFIGRADKRLPELLKRVRGSAVLTVSDSNDFARHGGIVGFYAEAGKIKLEINPETALAANLRISAKLLELARTVP